MSSAVYPEVGLAADLVQRATDDDLVHLLKYGGQFVKKDDLGELFVSFGNTGRKLKQLGILFKDRDGSWIRDDEAVKNLSEKDAMSVVGHYDKMCRAHVPVLNAIRNSDGMYDYADYFEKMHKPAVLLAEDERDARGSDAPDVEYVEEVIHATTDDSKKAMIGGALGLLEAIHQDPGGATFLKGLSKEDISSLEEALDDANYLMPGMVSSTREEPLSAQSLRGSEEQQEAILAAARTVAANIEFPESISQGDRPMLAAAVLKSAVDNAEYYDIVETSVKLPENNVSLSAEEAQMIIDLREAGDQMTMKTTMEIGGEYLLIPQSALEALDENLDGVSGVLLKLESPKFSAPGMGRDSGKLLAEMITSLREVRNYQPPESYEIASADDGGRATESGFESDSFDADPAEEDSTYKAGAADSAAPKTSARKKGETEQQHRERLNKELLAEMEDAKGHLAAEDFSQKAEEFVKNLLPEEETFLKIPPEDFDQWEGRSIRITTSGISETLDRIAGNDVATLSYGVDRGGFPQLTDALRAGSNSQVVIMNNDDFAVSHKRHQELIAADPSRSKNRVMKIEPGKGFLEDRKYRVPSADNAQAYVNNFIHENLIDRDGKPDVGFRRAVKEVAARTTVAGSQKEAIAWKLAAQRLVELDKEEEDLRREVMDEKNGKTFITLPAKDVRKFCDLIQASGSEKSANLTIAADGSAKMTHPEAPDVVAQIEDVPPQVSGMKEDQTMSFYIDTDRVHAALAASGSDRDPHAVLTGNSLRGFMSDIDKKHLTKEASQVVNPYPDVALS